MAQFTEASHNVLFSLGRDEIHHDLRISGKADIVRFQEAGTLRVAGIIRRWCDQHGFDLYPAGIGGNAIAWRKSVFKQALDASMQPIQGRKVVHKSAADMGVEMPSPARDFTFVGLIHRETLRRVLVINAHPIAQATKPESNPDTRYKTPEQHRWADWAIGQYWLDVVGFTASQISRQISRDVPASFWDAITLGGDYNAALDSVDRWYYPANLLSTLYRPDKIERGLDHLQQTIHSDLRVMRRWRITAVKTDHPIHFVRYEFKPVADFPRDL